MGVLHLLISTFLFLNFGASTFAQEVSDGNGSNLTMSTYALDESTIQLFRYDDSSDNPTIEKPSNPDCSKFDASKKTIVMCHGWQGAAANDNPQKLRAAFRYQNVNLYLCNYPQAAKDYSSLSANAPAIGNSYAEQYLKPLMDKCGMKADNMHLIGHSMGAHIMGFAAKNIATSKGTTISRVSGLDPANPDYNSNPCAKRLCATDAKTVDSYHTSDSLGMTNPSGTVDIYINHGTKQPMCSGLLAAGCNHNSVCQYYADSVSKSPNKWAAQKCASADMARDTKSVSCTSAGCYMGYSTTCQPGIYQVTTTSY